MIASLSCLVRQGLMLASCCVLLLIASGDLRAAVTIQTDDGRELSGEIDERTTEQQLWIRREEDRIVLTTSVDWSSVVAAAVDGEKVEVATLQEQWPELKSVGPPRKLSQVMEIGVRVDENRLYRHPQVRRIASLEIEAWLVNLDRDVEPDGFEVTIAAIDEYGLPVPVRGNITARLVGERDERHTGRVIFDELQRWSHPVRLADFEHGVASYALRFRTVRPEFDLELLPHALLNVRLGVTGQGNFEASVPVTIRHFNLFRDELQKNDRSRFLRDELSEEVRHREVHYPRSGLQAWSLAPFRTAH